MARSDYAAILDRHAGKAEALAGRVMVPVVDATLPDGCCGHAVVDPAAIHGNRWPALYGGFLFDLAERIGRCALPAATPLVLDVHFLKAIRRADVPEPDGLRLPWRATVRPASGGTVAVTTVIGAEGDAFAYGSALFSARDDADSRITATATVAPTYLVLPAHDPGWEPGLIRGRCLQLPGSLPGIADTLVAKAMATVRGDGCTEDADEHFLVRTLSYVWLAPIDDGLARFEARVVQRGRRMALATGELTIDGRPVGRTTGTVVIQRVPK
jgi:acyl-coenzyme A thioesterase PaaI-like protein